MGWWAAIPAIVSAASSLVSQQSGANAAAQQAKAQQEQLDAENERQSRREDAYNALIGRGTKDFGEGETQFLSTYEKAPTELEQVKKDILSGGTAAMKAGSTQMQSDLASQGVRGGQASTLLARGAGEMTRGVQSDVDKQVLSEALERRQAKGGYFGQKAQRGQAATYTAPTF